MHCSPARVVRPAHEHEIVHIVRQAVADGLTLRVAGAGHSFAPLVCTDGVLLDITRLEGCVGIDTAAGTATFWAGTPVRDVNRILAADGLALATMGTSRSSTIAGAVITGTHGNCTNAAVMAQHLTAFRLITACGEILDCSPHSNPDIFGTGRISLGALGVVTQVTLRCVPAFALHTARMCHSLSGFSTLADSILDQASYASAWWYPDSEHVVLEQAQPVRKLLRKPVSKDIAGDVVLWAAVTAGRIQPRYTRLARRPPSGYRSRTLPNSAALTVSQRIPFHALEYAIPIGELTTVLHTFRAMLQEEATGMPWPIEIRFSRRDDLPLSLAESRDTAYLNIVVDPRRRDMSHVLWLAERVLADLDGRPHLAKLHSLDTDEIARCYPAVEQLDQLRRTIDPSRVFSNPYLERILGW